MNAPNTGEVVLKVEASGRVGAQLCWSEACVLLSILLIAISCVGVYPRKSSVWDRAISEKLLEGLTDQTHLSV